MQTSPACTARRNLEFDILKRLDCTRLTGICQNDVSRQVSENDDCPFKTPDREEGDFPRGRLEEESSSSEELSEELFYLLYPEVIPQVVLFGKMLPWEFNPELREGQNPTRQSSVEPREGFYQNETLSTPANPIQGQLGIASTPASLSHHVQGAENQYMSYSVYTDFCTSHQQDASYKEDELSLAFPSSVPTAEEAIPRESWVHVSQEELAPLPPRASDSVPQEVGPPVSQSTAIPWPSSQEPLPPLPPQLARIPSGGTITGMRSTASGNSQTYATLSSFQQSAEQIGGSTSLRYTVSSPSPLTSQPERHATPSSAPPAWHIPRVHSTLSTGQTDMWNSNLPQIEGGRNPQPGALLRQDWGRSPLNTSISTATSPHQGGWTPSTDSRRRIPGDEKTRSSLEIQQNTCSPQQMTRSLPGREASQESKECIFLDNQEGGGRVDRAPVVGPGPLRVYQHAGGQYVHQPQESPVQQSNFQNEGVGQTQPAYFSAPGSSPGMMDHPSAKPSAWTSASGAQLLTLKAGSTAVSSSPTVKPEQLPLVLPQGMAIEQLLAEVEEGTSAAMSQVRFQTQLGGLGALSRTLEGAAPQQVFLSPQPSSQHTPVKSRNPGSGGFMDVPRARDLSFSPTYDESGPKRLKRAKFTKEAVSILNTWFTEHIYCPYPSEEQKQNLARQAGLMESQVNCWFINARMRKWWPGGNLARGKGKGLPEPQAREVERLVAELRAAVEGGSVTGNLGDGTRPRPGMMGRGVPAQPTGRPRALIIAQLTEALQSVNEISGQKKRPAEEDAESSRKGLKESEDDESDEWLQEEDDGGDDGSNGPDGSRKGGGGGGAGASGTGGARDGGPSDGTSKGGGGGCGGSGSGGNATDRGSRSGREGREGRQPGARNSPDGNSFYDLSSPAKDMVVQEYLSSPYPSNLWAAKDKGRKRHHPSSCRTPGEPLPKCGQRVLVGLEELCKRKFSRDAVLPELRGTHELQPPVMNGWSIFNIT